MNTPSTKDETAVLTVDDSEFEELLTDAYDAPPIPRSLLKRLDKGVENAWGVSPRLAETQATRLGDSLFRGVRWVRRLPLAAALSLLLLCAVMFLRPRDIYAWARVVDALEMQEFVQLDGDGVHRWMAPSEGLLAEKNDEQYELLDTHAEILLTRNRDDSAIQRRPVIVGSGRHSRDRLILRFLLGAANVRASESFIASAHLVEETLESEHTGSEGSSVALNVRFESDQADSGGEFVSVRLLLNPDTFLPDRCEVTNGTAMNATTSDTSSTVALSYPNATVAERLAVEFPAELPVVDVDPAAPVKTVLNPAVSNPGIPNLDVAILDPVVAVPAAADVPDLNGLKELVDGSSESAITNAAADVSADEGSPFATVPSKWPAVQLHQRSTGEAIAAVDRLLQNLWRENAVQPVAPAGDDELLRRVYLDLIGRTPSVSEVRAYFSDESDDRYAALVARLLDSPDHATHLAAMFRSFLIPEGVDLTNFGGVQDFDKWLSQEFLSGQPYDSIVRTLLLAQGRLSHSGPLLFYSAAKLDADQLAARTARVFLGTRLECAQCHDHPFEAWTQQDFWGFAAFFARISRPQGQLETVSSVMQVRDVNRGEVTMPDSELAVAPKFLNSQAQLSLDQPNQRRQKLANWLTATDNPYFPRATANRVWGMMFGKGIVNPIDDFGAENPPSAPHLLDALAGHLVSSGYDLKELFRVVALSQAYRLSSGADSEEELRAEVFAQMNVKMLSAEQVYDCITVATMLQENVVADPLGFNVARFGNTSRDAFLQEFRTPSGRATEYQGGIPQALTLMNGGLISSATGLSSSGLLKSLEAPFFSNRQRIEVLYYATLSRRPRSAEWDLLNSYISDEASGQELREGLADVLWALLNSAEFTMNH